MYRQYTTYIKTWCNNYNYVIFGYMFRPFTAETCSLLHYYSTALIISKNFHILWSFKANEMGSHWVLFLLYLNIVLNWLEDGRLRPKHVAKYNLIVIIASCLDVCCVLTVRNTLYKFDKTQRDDLSLSLKKKLILQNTGSHQTESQQFATLWRYFCNNRLIPRPVTRRSYHIANKQFHFI